MQTFAANEAKTQFWHFIDITQHEPVRVMCRKKMVGVMLFAREGETMWAF